MDIKRVKQFLAWCLVINFSILIAWTIAIVAGHDLILNIHSRWFPLTANQFDLVLYSALAVYKIGTILFNLVPYIALHIIERRPAAG